MRTRLAALAVAALVMTGLAACDPPAGSGLTVKATTATTGLQPGSTIDVRVAGVQPRQTVYVQQCAFDGPCFGATTKRFTADANGAVTVRWSVEGASSAMEPGWIWGSQEFAGCRPPGRCTIQVGTAVDLDGTPEGTRSVPLTLKGERVTSTATPTVGLRAGDRITVTGRARGAEGRRVRIALAERIVPRNERGVTKVGSSVYVTVKADGTFSGTFTVPASPATVCRTDSYYQCTITAWVLKADGSVIDPSFGKPTTDIAFR